VEKFMSLWWLFAAAVAGAWVLTAVLRRYALAHSVMDIPNARSSHQHPTPRGGGVAIVISFLLLAFFLAASFPFVTRTCAISLLGGCAWVAAVGFLDDHGHIPARWRLLAHFAGAGWVLYWLAGLSPLPFFGVIVDMGWIGYVVAAFYLVWLLNLYNFMDGIDGLASVEAICVSLGGAVIYVILDYPQLAVVPTLLACAVAGFLFWNFPRAKIFMGDAGSGFLGMALGVMSLQAAWVAPQLLFCWLILLGVFIVDATLTLFRRLVRGDKVYQAHRSHAYQYASRWYGSHIPVTVGVCVINAIWLFPLAWLVAISQINGLVGLVISYVPLLALALTFRAGQREK